MPRFAPNKMSGEVKRRYFELIRAGTRGSVAARTVGVSVSCGSVWFVDAGGVSFVDAPVSPRFMSQDDRIEIADGLLAGRTVKDIAAKIGKSYQSVYREIARNRKSDGRYQPWFAHGQAHLRRRRPKLRRFEANIALRKVVAAKLEQDWSPAQISRWLRRRHPQRADWHVCHETIYDAVYRGLVVVPDRGTLRTGRVYRHRRGRGRNREGALRQLTAMKSIRSRPVIVESRLQSGHWEGDLIIGTGRSAIATLVERKSRSTILVPIRGSHTAQRTSDAYLGPGQRDVASREDRAGHWCQQSVSVGHEGLQVVEAGP